MFIGFYVMWDYILYQEICRHHQILFGTDYEYHLYDDQERHQGRFDSVYELRKFLCDRKYDVQCDKDIGCTFDYIKHIKWFFEIEE